jgi:hypothetical protein
MQQKCTILQQFVQSAYTQPAYALQACMQGTYFKLVCKVHICAAQTHIYFVMHVCIKNILEFQVLFSEPQKLDTRYYRNRGGVTAQPPLITFPIYYVHTNVSALGRVACRPCAQAAISHLVDPIFHKTHSFIPSRYWCVSNTYRV